MREGAKHILVVDDSKINLTIVKQALNEYMVTPVLSGKQALKFLERKTPDLILLDVNMPEMDGRETLREIRRQERLRNIPVVFITADNTAETELECLELGAEDYISKPFVPEVMRQRIDRILELWGLRHELEVQLVQRTRQVEKITRQSITAIAYAIDAKDPYTHGHSVRVAKCSVEIAKRLNWSPEDQQNLFYAGLLHDIGKIGIPDSILNKASSLTPEEMAVMRKHPLTGGEILKDIQSIRHMEEGARYHHEWYNGMGYPYGLKGENIPLVARIIGVADAYDAMTSTRAYRSRLSDERVKEEFQNGRGKQFDPLLTDIFLEMLRRGFELTEETDGSLLETEGESGLLLHNMLTTYKPDVEMNFARDFLTGLHSKSYAQGEIGQYLGSGGNCAIFMVGVDNFRYITDNFGHVAGDTVLREVARLLSQEEGDSSFAARIGSDEFLVFYAGNTDWRQLAARAEELVQRSRDYFRDTSYGSHVSISVGIAVAPEDGKTFDEIYSSADKALYYVRRNGKGDYQFFSEKGEVGVASGTNADADILRQIAKGWQPHFPEGALHVNSREFISICEFLHRCVDRKKQQIQVALLTVTDNKSVRKSDPQVVEEAMELLESAIAESIRSMDVSTRYSSCQILVALVDSNLENGKKVVERIIGRFGEVYPTERILLTYQIQEMVPKQTEAEDAV